MNCDRIARWYQLLEYLVFGTALERRRREYISEVAGARSVLVLGDGDGRFTAEFLRQNTAASVDSVDLSFQMLRLAKRRVCACPASEARVRFCHGDVRLIHLAGQYDLVVSHFFLDCFTADELPALIARVAESARPQAQWLISEFGLPNRGVQRWAATLIIRAMYLFFHMLTGLRARRLPEYASSLRRQGFRLAQRKSTWGGLLISELWERA